MLLASPVQRVIEIVRSKQHDTIEASNNGPALVGIMKEHAWRLLEPPPQLFEIPDGASNEIRDVVEAFGAHCIAIHDSAKQAVGLPDDEDDWNAMVEEFRSMPGAWTTDPESSDSEKPEPATVTSKAKGKWVMRASTFARYPSQSMAQMLRSRSLLRATGKGAAHASRGSKVECVSCLEDRPAITSAHLACQHWYCDECFVALILNAMSSENQWPPQCCRLELPRDLTLRYLSTNQAKQFGEKEEEYSTPAKDRWYCSYPACGQWFKPQNQGTDVICTHCTHKMCPHCRGPAHNAKTECRQDVNLAALKKEAELEGWVSTLR